MNQYGDRERGKNLTRDEAGRSRQTGSRPGSSRAKGSASSRPASSRSGGGQPRSQGAASRNTGSRSTGTSPRSTAAGARSRSSQVRRSTRSHRPKRNYKMIAIGGVLLILVIFGLAMMFQKTSAIGEESSSETETETELQREVVVDGVSITGMSREEAREAILKKYAWDMKVTYQEDVYEVENLIGDKADQLLQEIFTGEPKESYSLDTSGMEDAIKKEVANMAERWDKPARNGEISGFDKEKGSFIYSGEETGVVIDQEKLVEDISLAVASHDFTASIPAEGHEVAPEISEAQAKEMYKVIGQYSTTTTANKARNTNIKLACESIDGKIIMPGETFSFNETTGKRSEDKGYRPAGAYVNGKLVEEPGGGVCQVSTTLYNAVIFSGLNTTERHAHSFEPSYVTPGEDAAVSYGGPDMKFVNTANTAIAIRAKLGGSLSGKMTITMSIVGIPILEDGVTISMHSEKTKELPPAEPTYEEDQTLAPGEEKVVKQGDNGSVWTTNIIKKKNGEVISDEFFHTSRYKGHETIIRRNTSDVQITESGEGESESSENPEESSSQSTEESGGPGPHPGEVTVVEPSGGQTESPSHSTDNPGGSGQTAPPPSSGNGGPTSVPGGPGGSDSAPGVAAPPSSGNGGPISVPGGPGM